MFGIVPISITLSKKISKIHNLSWISIIMHNVNVETMALLPNWCENALETSCLGSLFLSEILEFKCGKNAKNFVLWLLELDAIVYRSE